jgi:hypothetical protein
MIRTFASDQSNSWDCRHFASLIARTTKGGTALYFEVAGHKSALKVKDLNPDYKQDLNAPTS